MYLKQALAVRERYIAGTEELSFPVYENNLQHYYIPQSGKYVSIDHPILRRGNKDILISSTTSYI